MKKRSNILDTCTNEKIYLLEQLNPFPEYPTLHSQSKEPSLSVQVALGWHGLLEHSLMSKKIIQVTNNKGWKKGQIF
jgi:hypothetical protein